MAVQLALRRERPASNLSRLVRIPVTSRLGCVLTYLFLCGANAQSDASASRAMASPPDGQHDFDFEFGA
jgi:hypothetical protein